MLTFAAPSPTDVAGERRTAPAGTVCQVLHSLSIGGAEVLAAELARRLGDRYRFVFACLDELGPLGEQLRREGVQVEVLGRKAGFDVRCVRRLAEFARAQQVDVIHAHQYTPFFYSRAPGTLLRRPPVLFNEHGRFHPDYPRPKRIVFNRIFLRRCDRVVGVGNAVREALNRNEGIPARRVEVIYNGADLEKFSRDPVSRERARREMDVAEGEFAVIQVARLDYLKDHGTALRTIERVVAKHRQARLILVGDGPERPTIEKEIAARRLNGVVRLLGQRRDVPQLLAGADAFLLTSISEGIPVTFIEAMGARLPIVSTKVGGVTEVVEDGETGLLANAADDVVLAEALVRLMEDSRLKVRLGEAGRLRAERLFSETQMHAAYAKVYDDMLRGQ
jgi:glycosyltransferase involved in cell wall biosynthesis